MATSTPHGERDYVLYLRRSKGRAGIARQRRDCTTHAARIGGRIVAEFVDADRTAFVKVGAGPARRDRFTAMLDELRSDRRAQPLGVLAWHADRLDRDIGSGEALLSVCAQGKHPVETARSGSYDLSTPTGRKRFRNDIVDAQYEVDHMIERIEAAKVESAQEGRWLGGRRPFGYEADGVTVRPAEAAEVVRASEALLSGASLHAIMRDLNARAIPTSTGGKWLAVSVAAMLRRPRNAGLMEHRGEIVGKAEWPAIVPEETWRGVVALLNDPERRTSPGPGRRWLGSGLYECGVCVDDGRDDAFMVCATAGMSMGGVRSTVPAYRCADGRKHVARYAVHLDKYVEAVAVEWLSQPGAVAAFEGRSDDGAARARVLEREALRVRDEEAAEMFAEGLMTKAQLIKANQKTAQRRAELDQADTAAARVTALGPFRQGESAQAVWDGLDLDRKRTVLREIMRVIVLPAGKGRPRGWTPEYGKEWGYFDPDAIRLEKKASAGEAPAL
ncbi:recombinase family protein [Nonomuraea rhizosphaerae]|uniref:recombinase family protein n=1 Tax=Nonomuraea rhizosphaerae TaxID=2665663 RepID=UPI001C5EBDDD|nr:recombinase family protein [Nonomuraea rhizosphaerae]